MNPYEPPLASAEPEVSIEGGTCIRISPVIWLVAMGASFVFIALPVLIAVAFGIDYGTLPSILVLVGFSLIGPIALARYMWDRLWLTPNAIVHQTLFGSKSIRIPDVTRLEWRTKPVSGTIVICHPAKQMTLYLGDYDQKDQREIISHLRTNIPHDRQSGWRG